LLAAACTHAERSVIGVRPGSSYCLVMQVISPMQMSNRHCSCCRKTEGTDDGPMICQNQRPLHLSRMIRRFSGFFIHLLVKELVICVFGFSRLICILASKFHSCSPTPLQNPRSAYSLRLCHDQKGILGPTSVCIRYLGQWTPALNSTLHENIDGKKWCKFSKHHHYR